MADFDDEIAALEAAKGKRDADAGDAAQDDAEARPMTRAEIADMINGALTGHLRRAMPKLIAEAVGKLTPKTAVQSGNAAAEELADLKRQLAEEKAARVNTQFDATARAALEGKGIKGTRATAVIAYLKSTGGLQLDDDGNCTFAVSRIRQRGGAVEEQVFDNFEAGLEDWSKTADAAEFLPAPGANRQRPAARPAVQRSAAQPYDPRNVPTEDACARSALADIGDAFANLIDE